MRRFSRIFSVVLLGLIFCSVEAFCQQNAPAGAESSNGLISNLFGATEGLLEVGAEAPDFTLPSDTGEQVTLSSFEGKKKVVLYFYPRDFTPGCTQEALAFKEDNEKFKRADTVVLGVSVDSVKSHQNFSKKHELNFPLLSDTGGKVASQYGVMGVIMSKRVTYIIGLDGKISHVFPEVNVLGHSKAVLKLVSASPDNRSPLPSAMPKSDSR
ncbi:MAG: peroxiredoxin [Bdellovibrionota bacterium]